MLLGNSFWFSRDPPPNHPHKLYPKMPNDAGTAAAGVLGGAAPARVHVLEQANKDLWYIPVGFLWDLDCSWDAMRKPHQTRVQDLQPL